MKKLILICIAIIAVRTAAGQELNGVTFGFGAGYSYSFQRTYDYSLTTDGNYALKPQTLNKGGFVIASVLMVKLGKLTYLPTNSKKRNLRRSSDTTQVARFWDRLSANLALNLVDIKPDVSFNKNIDGGLGLGFFCNDNIQLALFLDVSRVRQLRDYIRNTYENKAIPNGTGKVYNALDPGNNDLFYGKTVAGLSFKLVYSIGNKKQAAAQPLTK